MFLILISTVVLCCMSLFFVKQKTAYEMRISDWSSDVCSSDLAAPGRRRRRLARDLRRRPRAVARVAFAAHRCRRDRVGAARGDAQVRTQDDRREIGRASCRERGWQYV